LFDDVEVFDFPKPVDYIKLILQQGAPNDALVLDFFSGSATTAHAVMQLNAEDSGDRQFILVQLPEKCPEKSAAFTAGYKTIDEIGQARIKKAAAKIAEENPLLAKTMDLGFKHYTLKEVEGKTLDKIEKFDLNDNALAATDDILKEFGVDTVLATWLVHDGYGFSAEPKVVDLDGYKAYWMEKHIYLIEPGLSDKGISALFDKFETEGAFNPGNVVVFGYSFSWTQLEALKNNLLKIAANGTNKHVILDKRY
jgi:type III restriction enzyme/adenine-specific DNA-methyltransferase